MEVLVKNEPNIVHLSDIHFGHLKVKTEHTLNGLKKYAIPYIEKADIIVIAGDIFDMGISLDSPDATLIFDFFSYLFKIMQKNNSILRVIRGTLSHDRNQLKILNSIYDEDKFTFDFKYINKIYLEYIDKWKLKVLYFPDNLSFKTSEEVIKYFKKEMNNFGWTYVDYAIGHGDFVHSYNEHVILSKVVYREEQFNFVKKYVLMGHVHTASKRGNIIYAGSFNRLRHGEESPKGFFVIENNVIKFIPNQEAMVFKTFTIKKKMSKDTIMLQLNRCLNTYFNKNEKGYLRISDAPIEIKQAIKNLISKEYPKIGLTFKKLKVIKAKYQELIIRNKVKLTPPTYNNLHLLIHDTLIKNKLTTTLNEDKIHDLINEIRT